MTRLATASRLSTLAEWAADHRGMAITDAVLRQAAIVLCDDLGAIVSVAKDPLLSALSEQLLRECGKPEATDSLGGDSNFGLNRALSVSCTGVLSQTESHKVPPQPVRSFPLARF